MSQDEAETWTHRSDFARHVTGQSELDSEVSEWVWQWDGHSWKQREEAVAEERALTIYVNQSELSTIVCTPTDIPDLVVGFLASEGIIRQSSHITSIEISLRQGTVHVGLPWKVNFNQNFFNKRYVASCCGKSRQSFYFINDAHTAKVIEEKYTVTPDEVTELMQHLLAASEVFTHTGGVHTAAIRLSSGAVVTRSDIGRHNALDKLFGWALRETVDTRGSVVALTGRLSSELVLKSAKLGAGVVVSKSAPTRLALALARELNMTAIGFARQHRFNVYSCPWRVMSTE